MASDIVVLCVDGYGNSGKIFNGVESAASLVNLSLDSNNYIKTVSQWSSSLSAIDIAAGIVVPFQFLNFIPDESPVELYTPLLDQLKQNNGGSFSNLKLLIVGKSYGGAKMYKYLESCNNILKKFKKVALVLVDSHEPIIPGDDGDPDRSYDYVNFDNNDDLDGDYYNLQWRDEWEQVFQLPANSAPDQKTKLKVFNIFQRIDGTKGYSFYNAHSVNKKLFNMNYSNQEPEHMGIDNCKETIHLICKAIDYLNYFTPELTIDKLQHKGNKQANGKIVAEIEIKFTIKCPPFGSIPEYSLFVDNGLYGTQGAFSGYEESRTILMELKFDSLEQKKDIRITLIAPTNWHEKIRVDKVMTLYPAEILVTSFLHNAPGVLAIDPTRSGYEGNYPDRRDNGLIPYDTTTIDLEIKRDLQANQTALYSQNIYLDADEFFRTHTQPVQADKEVYRIWSGYKYWYYDGYLKTPIKGRIFKNNGWISSPLPKGTIEVKRIDETTNNIMAVYNDNITDINDNFIIIGKPNGPTVYNDTTWQNPVRDEVTIKLTDSAGQEDECKYNFKSRYLIIVIQSYEIQQPTFSNLKDKILKIYCDPWADLLRSKLRILGLNIPRDLKSKVSAIIEDELERVIVAKGIKDKAKIYSKNANKNIFKLKLFNKPLSINHINTKIDELIEKENEKLTDYILERVEMDLFKKVNEKILR